MLEKVKVVNVWQIAGWNRNVGDWALTYHQHRLLNKHARPYGLFFKFYPLDGQLTYFYPSLVDQMNEEADLVMVGGGGLIFHRPEDKSVSGWGFNISIPDLHRIEKPVVVYALGNNKFAYSNNAFPEMTSIHMRELQKKSIYFSVRTTGVRNDMVSDFDLVPSKIEVIPDTGIYLHDRPISIPFKKRSGPLIAVNLAGDRPHYRYPEPAEENQQICFDILRSALLRAVKELDATIMFLPHLHALDFAPFDKFSEGFPLGSIFSTHLEMPYLYAPPGVLLHPHIPFFTNLYRQADLVMGMRLHSCIFAYGAATRFIPLGAQDKIKHFVEDSGVPDYTVFKEGVKDTSESIYGKIVECLKDQKFDEMLKKSLSAQTKLLRVFNEKIISLFNAKDS